jgi:hypothetical protein
MGASHVAVRGRNCQAHFTARARKCAYDNYELGSEVRAGYPRERWRRRRISVEVVTGGGIDSLPSFTL